MQVDDLVWPSNVHSLGRFGVHRMLIDSLLWANIGYRDLDGLDWERRGHIEC